MFVRFFFFSYHMFTEMNAPTFRCPSGFGPLLADLDPLLMGLSETKKHKTQETLTVENENSLSQWSGNKRSSAMEWVKTGSNFTA